MEECQMNGCVRERSKQHVLCPPCFDWIAHGKKGPAPNPGGVAPELPELNISLIANKLLDCEQNLREDEVTGYDPTCRGVALDLHYLLEEEFRGRSNHKPDDEYLKVLKLFCEFEDNPDDSADWRIDRNAVAGCLLAHLRLHKYVVGTEEWPPPQSDEVLKQFVNDFVKDKLFTDKHLKRVDEIMTVFLPLRLGAFVSRARHELSNVGVMYQHLSEAGPGAVDGLPCFLEIKLLNKADWERCMKAIGKHHEAQAEIEV